MGNACCQNSDEQPVGTLVAQVSSSTAPPPAATPPAAPKESPPVPAVAEPVEPKEPEVKEVVPRKSLLLTFKFPGREEEIEYQFTSRPLGMDFHRLLPITIKKVHSGSMAEQKGIQPGAVLTKVDGEDITDKRLEEMHTLLKRVASELPAN
mmetsp:Transcript_58248/g.123647  ORF Transcript_58248/g.123647 Transcript_58248/m.123647 type:complete len:151 (+) Transcript_58248:207-659(+)|eukprot:CAMPEP_0206454866 /NCGR_PEP_ID=MMETSP0324_2-20121206/21399_1 /ASSEMBLY_ACC=CAM_ASM_000836 /TAXON_ID=2866 /ORGANISM="Crypthecodinium cohnii, Strain Seligo" /LENGTH=150 /DNA_ID=CAMNT_0053925435 /DNA_START=148 /DNA_END=600 /DNA_ORIENTATION=-